MREGFREYIEDVAKLVRKKEQPGIAQEERTAARQELGARIDAWTHKRESDPQAQQAILKLQQKKRKIIRRLHEELNALDHPEQAHTQGKRRVARQDEQTNLFYQVDRGMEPVTLGELYTDGEWGIDCYLDPDFVDRKTCKQYLLERAKSELDALLDEQIMEDEIASPYTDTLHQEAYKEVKKNRAEHKFPPGIIAEKMVSNFLRKIGFDYGVDIEIERADAHEDVVGKIDFKVIIRKRNRQKGVKVDTHNDKTIGIQFTTNPTQETKEHKEHQIQTSKRKYSHASGIDDILLVRIPRDDTMSLYSQWNATQSAGGPDKLWPEEVREEIFKKVLEGIQGLDEINRQWDIVQGKEPSPSLAA